MKIFGRNRTIKKVDGGFTIDLTDNKPPRLPEDFVTRLKVIFKPSSVALQLHFSKYGYIVYVYGATQNIPMEVKE